MSAQIFSIAVFFSLTMPLPPAAAQEKHLLRTSWRPGTMNVIETETETTSTLTPSPGQSIEQKLKVVQTSEIDVQAAAGGKLATVTFASIKGEMTFMGQSHKYDSAEPLAGHPLLRQALGGSAGRKFILVYDEQDQVAGVKGTEMLAAGRAEIAGLGATADARQVAELFAKSIDLGLSDKPVAVGEKWTLHDELAFPQAGGMKVAIHSRFDEIVQREGRPHAKVIFEGTIASRPHPADGSGPPSVEVAGDSTIAGHVFFDLERRVVSLGVFLASLKLTLDGNCIPIRQQVTTKLLSTREKK